MILIQAHQKALKDHLFVDYPEPNSRYCKISVFSDIVVWLPENARVLVKKHMNF